MKKEPKLFKIIRALNVEDIGRVKKMLKSPFFTQNKNLPVLFNYLIKHYPDLDSKKLDKHIVFKKVFKDKTFSDSIYTNLCFECSRLIEQFFIIQKNEEDEYFRNAELYEVYLNKLGGALHSNNFSLYKNIEDKLERLVESDSTTSNVEQEHRKHLFHKRRLGQINYKKLNERITYYDNSLTALENYYQIEKAILRTERINLIVYLGNGDVSEPHIEYFNNLYFKLFNLLEEMITHQDFRAYERAKQLAFENAENLPNEIRRHVFSLLKNFLVRGQSINAALFSPELANLFLKIIDNEHLKTGHLFTSSDYINTIIMLSPIDLDFAIEFQKNNLKYLLDKDMVDAKKLSMAHIFYHQKKLKESFAIVSSHKFNRLMIELMARAHELRCGYEIFESDSDFGEFYSGRLVNIGKQFKRNTLPKSKKTALENLVIVLKKLVQRKITGDNNPETLRKILETINKMKNLTSREWLRKKISRQS